MTLIVHELFTEISQIIKPKRNSFVNSIRIHLYKHNYPAGKLRLELRDNNNRLIKASDELEISSISGDYYHGITTFNFSDASLRADQEYRIVLVTSDYEFTENEYVGWCNAYDLKAYEADYDFTDSKEAPLSFEIWTNK